MSELKPRPCPICGAELKIYGPEDWEPSFYDPDSGGDPYEANCDCGFSFSTDTYDYAEFVAALNRRAQPANEPLTLDELRKMLERLEMECQQASGGHEDYTNGYRWGHRNGQIELLRQILNTREGTCESDRHKPGGEQE